MLQRPDESGQSGLHAEGDVAVFHTVDHAARSNVAPANTMLTSSPMAAAITIWAANSAANSVDRVIFFSPSLVDAIKRGERAVPGPVF